MIIKATLTGISHSEDGKITFGEVSLVDEANLTASPVFYDFNIDENLGSWMPPIRVEKDGVTIHTSAYYSGRNFRGYGAKRRLSYWLVWKLIRESHQNGAWKIPAVMRFSFTHQDVSRQIMLPNTVRLETKYPVPANGPQQLVAHLEPLRANPEVLRANIKPLRFTMPPLTFSKPALKPATKP